VSKTTSTYCSFFTAYSRLLNSEQKVQECDATEA